MKNTIIFIHGMFQNKKSWDGWVKYYTEKGYNCIAESWPYHEGEPEDLRNNVPAGLGDLRLQEVIDKYAALVRSTDPEAILIGHSVGGLIVQSLINMGLGRAGICISSVAPNRMLSLDWGFFRNSMTITNPFKGDEPFYMTPEGFHQNFCNTLSREESDKYYEKTATHDSRNMLRDCLLEAGEIDLDKTNRPLLFISGDKDEIIPAKLDEKNAKAYKEGIAYFREFPDRGHFICGQPRWEEIAAYTSQWLQKQAFPVVRM
jgi:pimeloyl-ACP methyl ester carboxylesterase